VQVSTNLGEIILVWQVFFPDDLVDLIAVFLLYPKTKLIGLQSRQRTHPRSPRTLRSDRDRLPPHSHQGRMRARRWGSNMRWICRREDGRRYIRRRYRSTELIRHRHLRQRHRVTLTLRPRILKITVLLVLGRDTRTLSLPPPPPPSWTDLYI
jgi:hypothetical protein